MIFHVTDTAIMQFSCILCFLLPISLQIFKYKNFVCTVSVTFIILRAIKYHRICKRKWNNGIENVIQLIEYNIKLCFLLIISPLDQRAVLTVGSSKKLIVWLNKVQPTDRKVVKCLWGGILWRQIQISARILVSRTESGLFCCEYCFWRFHMKYYTAQLMTASDEFFISHSSNVRMWLKYPLFSISEQWMLKKFLDFKPQYSQTTEKTNYFWKSTKKKSFEIFIFF